MTDKVNNETDHNEPVEEKQSDTLEQEIERLGESFPKIAELLSRATKFFR